MGIFQPTPLPPIVSSSGTLPLPHSPVGNQGDQPPRRSIAGLMAIVAMWPVATGPTLERPNLDRVKIAPLTLAYGTQPVPSGPLSVTQYTNLVASRPPDREPVLGVPNGQQVKIAPLTLIYGQQTPLAPLSATEIAQIVSMWQVSWGAQSAAPNAAWNVPFIPPVVDVPIGKRLPDWLFAAWQPAWYGPPRPVSIVTLQLPTGAAPVPSGPLSVVEVINIVGQWPLGVGPQLPYAPPRTAGVTSQPRADQPPVLGPVTPSEYAQLVSQWQQTWGAQTAPPNAGWNVPPILSAVVYAPLPRLIWTAWEPPYIAPPRPVSIVVLTLPTGQQPPTQYALSINTLLATVAQWREDWKSQAVAPSAGWNVPPIVVRVPFATPPRLVWTAWEPPYIAPPRPVIIAPLTLPRGVQPPPISPLAVNKIMLAVRLWEQTWGAQSAANNAAINIPVTRIASVVRMTADSVTFATMSGDVITVNTMTGDIMQDSD